MKASSARFVVPRGFEPRQTEPKSVVLPLYYGTMLLKGAKIRLERRISKWKLVFTSGFSNSLSTDQTQSGSHYQLI